MNRITIVERLLDLILSKVSHPFMKKTGTRALSVLVPAQ